MKKFNLQAADEAIRLAEKILRAKADSCESIR